MDLIPINAEGLKPATTQTSAPDTNIIPIDTKDIVPIKMDKSANKEEVTDEPIFSKERIYANAQAAYSGALKFGSTLAKMAEKFDSGMKYITKKATGIDTSNSAFSLKGVGQEAQNAFEASNAKYEENKKKYPEVRVSNFLGELAAEGPLVSGRAITAGGALGKALGGGIGELAGTMAAGGATGAAIGGLSNKPGMAADDVWDEENARSAGVLGAALGPVGGMILPRWAQTTTAYQAGKDSLRAAGYEGPILARDYTPDGFVKNIKNKLLDNIPLVTTGTRDKQMGAVNDAVKQLVSKISDRGIGQSEEAIGSILNRTRDAMAHQGNQMWDDVFKTAKNSGVSKIAISDNAKTAVTDILAKYGDEISAVDKKKFLDPIAKYKELSPEYMHAIKRDLWPLYTKIAKKESTVAENLSNELKDLYWKMDDNLGSAFKAVPELEQKYLASKEYTKNMLNVFDPKKDRYLAKAVNEVNDKTENLRGFVNSIMRPKSDKTMPYYNKIFGSGFADEAEKISLQRNFDASFDYIKGDLNLNKFFKNAEAAANNSVIKTDTWKALQGLEKYAQSIGAAQNTAAKSGARHIQTSVPVAATFSLAGSALGTSAAEASLGAVGGLAASAATLGWISKSSPAKNALIQLSKVWGKNPEITKKLVNQLGRSLPAVGVTMSPLDDEEGTVRIDKTGKK